MRKNSSYWSPPYTNLGPGRVGSGPKNWPASKSATTPSFQAVLGDWGRCHSKYHNAVAAEVCAGVKTVNQSQWVIDRLSNTVVRQNWGEVIELLLPEQLKPLDSGSLEKQMVRTRLQKSWSTTTPMLDRWHHGMDWDEDQWSGCSSGRSWLLKKDTTRRQPFLWRKALNDHDEYAL